MAKGRRAAGALLAAAVAGAVCLCAQQALRPADLGGAALAAGSFLANPPAAAGAVLRALRGEDAQQSSDASSAAGAAPGASPAPPASPSGPWQDEAGPSPEPTQPIETDPVPTPARPAEPPVGAGAIVSAHYQQGSGEGYVACGAASIKNCTALPDAELADIIAGGMPFAVEAGSEEPQVLIMHTHATETYEMADNGWYDPAFTCRSTDTAVNMAAVGARIAQKLNAAGICTLQDTTLHDYPSYNGSYAKSNETVRWYLEQYPSIKVVLDVHRDAIEQQDGTRVKPLAEIDGRPCAQVMIICGADRGGNLPNFRENLRFAAAWQNAMESRFAGLTRPVLFDYRYYNQDLTTGSLLIEIGGHANTLEEALYAGDLVGEALAGLFTEEQ